MKYVLLLFSMILAVLGQFALKKGLDGLVLLANPLSIGKVIFTPMVFLGFVLYGSSSILWLFVLKRFPLSVAYPAVSLTYVATLFISWKFFGETIGWSKVLGVVMIVLGVGFIFS